MTTPQTLSNGALPCFRCGMVARPRIDPGTGPHESKASCGSCGRFLKWVPKALVQQKEVGMPGGVNRVVLLGTVGKYGCELRYAASGAVCASFTIVVSEQGQDGKTHDVFVPCECWGKKAEAMSEIEAGALVLFEGKLRKRQKGEQWELIVSGFEVTQVLIPATTGV